MLQRAVHELVPMLHPDSYSTLTWALLDKWDPGVILDYPEASSVSDAIIGLLDSVFTSPPIPPHYIECAKGSVKEVMDDIMCGYAGEYIGTARIRHGAQEDRERRYAEMREHSPPVREPDLEDFLDCPDIALSQVEDDIRDNPVRCLDSAVEVGSHVATGMVITRPELMQVLFTQWLPPLSQWTSILVDPHEATTLALCMVEPLDSYDVPRVVSVMWYTDGSGDDSSDSPAPSWAFAVVVELDFKGSNVFRVAGHQAGFVISDPTHPHWIGATACNSQTAELSAIVWALLWALTWWPMLLGSQAVPQEFVFYFDSTAAGGAVFWAWNSSSDPVLVRVATNLRFLLQTQMHVRGVHVPAHVGHPWNEYADCMCRTLCRYPVRLLRHLLASSIPVDVCCMLTEEGGAMTDWLYVQGLPSYLQDQYLMQGGVTTGYHLSLPFEFVCSDSEILPAIDKSCANNPVLHTRQPIVSRPIHLLDANVQTLRRKGKRSYFRDQMHAHRLLMLGMQEAHPNAETERTKDDIHTISTRSTAKGTHGCELWINLRIPVATHVQTKYYIRALDCSVMHADPTRLIVRVSSSALRVMCIVLHAPHMEREGEVEPWWSTTIQLLVELCTGWSKIVFIDANIDDSFLVRSRRARPYKYRHCFHRFLQETGLWAPVWTHAHRMRGEFVSQATFVRRDSEALIDYILLSDDYVPVPRSVGPHTSFDIFTRGVDHRATTMQVHIANRQLHAPIQKRRVVQYDRIRAGSPDPNTRLAVSQQLREGAPIVGMRADSSSRLQLLDQFIHSTLCEWFPKTKVPPRQAHYSETTRDLLHQASVLCKRSYSWYKRVHAKELVFQALRDPDIIPVADTLDPVRFPYPKDACMAAAVQLAVSMAMSKKAHAAMHQDDLARLQQHLESMSDAYNSGCPMRMHAATRQILRVKRWKAQPVVALLDEDGKRSSGHVEVQLCFRRFFAGIMEATVTTLARLVQAQRFDQLLRMDEFKAVVRDRACIIPRADIERRFRHMKPKAISEDGIGGEVYANWYSELAEMYGPLLFNQAIRIDVPIQAKGGFLMTLWKQKHSHLLCSAYRDVTISHTGAKGPSKALRQKAMPALHAMSFGSQYGSGLNGGMTAFARLHTRATADIAQVDGNSCCQAFIDAERAFARMCRALTLALPEDDEALLRRIHSSGISKEAMDRLVDQLRTQDSWYEAPGSPHLSALLVQHHRHNWISQEFIPGVIEVDTGSLAGTSLADLVFSANMTVIIREIRRLKTKEGLDYSIPEGTVNLFDRDSRPTERPIQITDVSYADDLQDSVIAPSDRLLLQTIRTLQIIDICFMVAGMMINYERGKSGLIFHYNGPGSSLLRSMVENHYAKAIRIPVPDKRSEIIVYSEISYKHVGTQEARATAMVYDAVDKSRRIHRASKDMHSILTDATCPLKTRRLLAILHIFSAGYFHTGTWPVLHAYEFKRMHSATMAVYRKMLPKSQRVRPEVWLSDVQVLREVELPPPFLLLARARIQLFTQVIAKAPVTLQVLLSYAHNAKRSWLKAVKADMDWLAMHSSHFSEFALEDMDQPLFVSRMIPAPLSQWVQVCARSPLRLRQRVQQAIHDDEVRPLVHWPLSTLSTTVSDDIFHCSQCQFTANTRQRVALHEYTVHGVRRDTRRKVNAPWCEVCLRYFHTIERTICHLHEGSARCLFVYRTCIPDLPPEEQELAMSLAQAENRELAVRGLRNHKAEDRWQQMQGPMMHEAFLAGLRHATTDAQGRDNGGRLLTGKRFNPRDTTRVMMAAAPAPPPDVPAPDPHPPVAPPRLPLSEAQKVRIAFSRLCAEEKRIRISSLLQVPPARWQATKAVIIICSGRIGSDDVGSHMEHLSDQLELSIIAIRFDPLVAKARDLTFRSQLHGIESLIRGQRVAAVMSSPPCSTVSKRRHKKLNKPAPRPLRGRADPLQPLRGLTRNERYKVVLANHLWIVCLHIVALASSLGIPTVTENPADPGPPFVSFWIARETKDVIQALSLHMVHVDQCQYGCQVQKATTLMCSNHLSSAMARTCTCRRHRGFSIINDQDEFASAELARYPPRFASAIANHLAEAIQATDTPVREDYSSDLLESEWAFHSDLPEAIRSSRRGQRKWQL